MNLISVISFLAVLLLSAAVNLDILKFSFSVRADNSLFSKAKILFICFTASIVTFLSMFIGKIIDIYFTKYLSNIFGAVLLGMVGIAFFVEYLRKKQYRNGYDTSFYYEDFKCYKNIIDFESEEHNPDLLKNITAVAAALSLDNIWPAAAGAVTGMSITLTVIFTFIFCVLFFFLGRKIKSRKFMNFIKFNSDLICAVLIIAAAFIEAFV